MPKINKDNNQNQEIKKALELIIAIAKYQIESELEDFGNNPDFHSEEFKAAVWKATANNLIVDEFKLDSELKIKIGK